MFDKWDIVALLGFGSLVAGIGFVYWPLALIVTGVGLLAMYVIREAGYHVPTPRNPNIHTSDRDPDADKKPGSR